MCVAWKKVSSIRITSRWSRRGEMSLPRHWGHTYVSKRGQLSRMWHYVYRSTGFHLSFCLTLGLCSPCWPLLCPSTWRHMGVTCYLCVRDTQKNVQPPTYFLWLYYYYYIYGIFFDSLILQLLLLSPTHPYCRCWLSPYVTQSEHNASNRYIPFDCSHRFRLWADRSLSIFYTYFRPLRFFLRFPLFISHFYSTAFIRFMCRIENVVLFFEPVQSLLIWKIPLLL